MTVIEATRSHPTVPPPAERPSTPGKEAGEGEAALVSPIRWVAAGEGKAALVSLIRLVAAKGALAGGRAEAVRRWARLIALAVGGFLVPWCVLLSKTLPHTAQAQNWSLAWIGLDAAEAAAALATAALLTRADPRASLTAMAVGVLLTVDAWFDICTSAPGLGHALALAEASCLELPLAAAAFCLALTLTRSAGNPADRNCRISPLEHLPPHSSQTESDISYCFTEVSSRGHG